MHPTVVPTDDVVLADTFMTLATLRIQTTSVLPSQCAIHIIDFDGVENPG